MPDETQIVYGWSPTYDEQQFQQFLLFLNKECEDLRAGSRELKNALDSLEASVQFDFLEDVASYSCAMRPFPPLPKNLIHCILCAAAERHPEIRSSLRLTASWVRELCQRHTKTLVVLKTLDQTRAFARFMAYQPPVPFKVDAIWFRHTAFKTIDEAAVVPYILTRCPDLSNVSLSVTAYVAVVHASLGPLNVDTRKITYLTVQDGYCDDETYLRYDEEQRRPSSTVFSHVTQLVLYNLYKDDKLTLGRYPFLRSIAICNPGPSPRRTNIDILNPWQIISSAPQLEHFVVVFPPEDPLDYGMWVNRCRTYDKGIFILESPVRPNSRSRHDLRGWKSQVRGGRSLWEIAVDYTAYIEKCIREMPQTSLR